MRTILALLAVLSLAARGAFADPLVQAETKLTAGDAAANDEFGINLAISGDTMIVGAHFDDDGGNNAGAAYVFVRSGTTWSEQAKLTALDAQAGDEFGFGVAIDGDTAVIGARFDDDGGSNAGAAYVFSRADGVWNQVAKLVAEDAGGGDEFGSFVAVSGNTIAIASHRDDDLGTDAGAAYVFEEADGIWVQQAKLTADDGAGGDVFGRFVAVDGDTIAVTARLADTDAGIDSGACYVFARIGSDWFQEAKLTPDDAAAGDEFGSAVGMDAGTIVVGALGDDDLGSFSGSAYVFEKNADGFWLQQIKLNASDGAASDLFGRSAGISGELLVIGASMDNNDGGSDAGAAYVFQRVAGIWTESLKLTASDGAASDELGNSVGIDGDTAVAGAHRNDDAGSSSGSAYAFLLGADCNGNGAPDQQDIADGNSADCNTNGIPDECDLANDPALDENGNGIIDSCEACEPPQVVVSPAAKAVCEGGAVSLSVAATGTEPLAYEWFHDGQSLGDMGPTLSIDSATQSDEGSYQVVVSNDCGMAASEFGRLWVQAPDELPPVVVAPQRVPERWQAEDVQWSGDVSPHNKIDDQIDASPPGDFDIVVNFNVDVGPAQEAALAAFGTIQLVGQYVSFICVAGVSDADIQTIAGDPTVAFIELQMPVEYDLDVAKQATKVASGFYSPNTIEDQFPNLDGSGVNIAIIDSGVDDPGGPGVTNQGLPAASFFYDAVNGTYTNPDDVVGHPGSGHGTHVAGIALGRGIGAVPPGLAPQAGLIDVSIDDGPGGVVATSAHALAALQELISKRVAWNVGVINMSIGYGVVSDDGQDSLSQSVNAAVGLGIVVICSAGNSGPNNNGLRRPGAADGAITVANSEDHGTADRTNDTLRDSSSRGPRASDNDANALDELKPEVTAPGTAIMSTLFNSTNGGVERTGTSMSAPHVAGVAALLLQSNPARTPGSIKQILMATAERRGTPSAPAVDPDWNDGWGWGLIDAYSIFAPQPTDLGFALFNGYVYANTRIETTSPPKVNVPNQIRALVENYGPFDATNVLVKFKIDYISATSWAFYDVGDVIVPSIPAGTQQWVSINWTPQHPDHQCLKARIDYALDSTPANNEAQRNITVAHSPVYFRVENLICADPITIDFVPQIEPPDTGWTVQFTPPNVTLAGGQHAIIEALPVPGPETPAGDQVTIYVSSMHDNCLLGGVAIIATMFDCNSNGVEDWIDIANGVSVDEDGNHVPDECDQVADVTLYEPGTAELVQASPDKLDENDKGTLQAGSEEMDPVYLFSGEYHLTEMDLQIPGRGVDFGWARKYRSRVGPNTPLGNGWDFSYNMRLEQVGADLRLHDGNSRRDLYALQPNGKWGRDEFFREIEQNPDGSYSVVFRHGGTWEFQPFDGSPQAGKIVAVTDRNGNSLTFEYDANGRLVTIHDTLDTPGHDRDITIAYNADGFIESVTDYVGRQVKYEYYQNGDAGGSLGDLKSVTSPAVTGTPHGNDFPLGKTTVYTYTSGFGDDRLNHNLLTITDAKGQTWLTNVYDPTQDPNDLNFDRVIRQVWGDPGDIIDAVYVPQTPEPANNFASMRTIVNDRVGNVREYFYDSTNRCVMARAYTGRADPHLPTTDALNRPTGQLRPNDPAFFETRYAYNDDSMLTSILYPNGNSVQSVHEYDLDPNALRRSRGNRREIHPLPGPLGGDQPDIVETFEYDDGAAGSNFVTRAVDGRGGETLHTYGANGNRLHTQHRIPSIVEDFEYNVFGQLTRHIHPDNGGGHRREDVFTYYTEADGPMNGYLKDAIVDEPNLALTRTYEYDAVGNVVREIDPRGNDTLYVVNALNQIVRRSSPIADSGVRFERDTWYDANNNIVRVDVQNIDEDGVLEGNTHLSIVYEFDILDFMTRMCEEAGDAALGPADLDCSALPPDEFVVTEYDYDANRNRTLVRYGEATSGSQPTNTVRTLYDERDLVFRVIRAETDPLQSTTQWDYDGNENRTAVIEGLEDNPRATTYAFDGFDRQVSTTDAMGNLTTWHYDANGNAVSSRIDGELVDVPGGAGNVRLAEPAYVYDAMDRNVRTERAFFDAATQAPIGDGLSITEAVLSDASQVLEVIDDNGHVTTAQHDTANRRSVVTDPLGTSVSFVYDGNSNVVVRTETDKSDLGSPDASFSTQYTYDALDRLTKVVDNAENTIEYAYDSRDNRTLMIDALRPDNANDPGNVTRSAYDGLSRLVSTERVLTDDGTGAGSPVGSIITTQVWDDSSRLTAQGDANGHVTTYSYDVLDRRIETQNADGTTHVETFDVHDNPVTASDANGSSVASQYDLLNRLTHRDITPGAEVSNDTTVEDYQYDGLSRLVLAQDDDAAVARAYDSLGHVTSESLNGVTTACEYDGESNQLLCEYPGGRLVETTYDGRNRPKTIGDQSAAIAGYDYVGTSRVERRTYNNGTQCDYAYDGARRIIGTSHVFDPAGANVPIDQRSHAWDRMSNKIEADDIRAGGPVLASSYSYDSIYRLVHATVVDANTNAIRNTAYDLDDVGNRNEVIGDPDPGTYALDLDTPDPADFQVNQYTLTPFDGREYDLNGNLIASGCLSGDINNDGVVDASDATLLAQALLDGDSPSWADVNNDGAVDGDDIQSFIAVLLGGVPPTRQFAMVYDYRNRMVRHEDVPAGVVSTYAYDCLGRRIQKVVDDGINAQTSRFYYDDWREIEEQDAGGNTLATYVFGNDLDELLTMRCHDCGESTMDFYYHGDDLHNVMALTDASGAVVERYAYQDYGEPTFLDASGALIPQSAIGNAHLFNGRRYDEESGLYDYRTRYLDPRAGRFTTRDVIGTWGDSLNLGNAYTYVGNNPLSRTDPFGLETGQQKEDRLEREIEKLQKKIEEEKEKIEKAKKDYDDKAKRARETIKKLESDAEKLKKMRDEIAKLRKEQKAAKKPREKEAVKGHADKIAELEKKIKELEDEASDKKREKELKTAKEQKAKDKAKRDKDVGDAEGKLKKAEEDKAKKEKELEEHKKTKKYKSAGGSGKGDHGREEYDD